MLNDDLNTILSLKEPESESSFDDEGDVSPFLLVKQPELEPQFDDEEDIY